MKNWTLANSRTTSVGTMVCGTCLEAIGDNCDFQYRQKTINKGTDWKYVVHHRGCAKGPVLKEWDKFEKSKSRENRIHDKATEICYDMGVDVGSESYYFLVDLMESGYTVDGAW